MNKNEIEVKAKTYGRKELFIVAFVLLFISLAMLTGGVVLIANGAMSAKVVSIVWKVIVGAIIVVIGGMIGWVSILMMFTAKGLMKNDKGNLKDENNSALGTANANLCANCGNELGKGATFCAKCGREVGGKVQCECGEINPIDAEFCNKCGKALK